MLNTDFAIGWRMQRNPRKPEGEYKERYPEKDHENEWENIVKAHGVQYSSFRCVSARRTEISRPRKMAGELTSQPISLQASSSIERGYPRKSTTIPPVCELWPP